MAQASALPSDCSHKWEIETQVVEEGQLTYRRCLNCPKREYFDFKHSGVRYKNVRYMR